MGRLMGEWMGGWVDERMEEWREGWREGGKGWDGRTHTHTIPVLRRVRDELLPSSGFNLAALL
jgi:hypothetical protein